MFLGVNVDKILSHCHGNYKYIDPVYKIERINDSEK